MKLIGYVVIAFASVGIASFALGAWVVIRVLEIELNKKV